MIWDLDFGEVLTDGGFDVVIANPPYVRQEEFKEIKEELKLHYDCYTGTSDLYTYFYEKGIKLLKDGGTLSYISSNKFFRAGYGAKLREYLSLKTRMNSIIDFGDLPVFEATTYPCVLITSKQTQSKDTKNWIRARTVESEEELAHFEDTFRQHAIDLPQSSLAGTGWRIEDTRVRALLEKITGTGISLNEFVGGKIYRGITTGYNSAFVIDEATKNLLLMLRKSPFSSAFFRCVLASEIASGCAAGKRWCVF